MFIFFPVGKTNSRRMTAALHARGSPRRVRAGKRDNQLDIGSMSMTRMAKMGPPDLNALIAAAITVLIGLAAEGQANEPVVIGDARMLEDGTIVVNLRRTADGIHVSGVVRYPVNDPNYKKVLDHIGGMHPGEVKLVPAWGDPGSEK
jgi:hypothetical protein